MRQPSRWKSVPRAGQRIRDTPHSHCCESHKNTNLHNVDYLAQSHTGFFVKHPFKKNLIFHLYSYCWFIACYILNPLPRLERHWWFWSSFKKVKGLLVNTHIVDQTAVVYDNSMLVFKPNFRLRARTEEKLWKTVLRKKGSINIGLERQFRGRQIQKTVGHQQRIWWQKSKLLSLSMSGVQRGIRGTWAISLKMTRILIVLIFHRMSH